MTKADAALGSSEPDIILDISRLLSRIRHGTPTGVDRVEYAYARHLQMAVPDRLHYAAVHPLGMYGRIPRETAIRFLDQMDDIWSGKTQIPSSVIRKQFHFLRRLWMMRPRRVPKGARRRIVIQTSPHHLHREDVVTTILRRENARWLCLVHDLIPIEYPEYARPGGARTHRRRMDTVADAADAVIVNSEATRQSFLRYRGADGRNTPVAVAHLGLHVEKSLSPSAGAEPYFLCLGTIEPRKNHLLLLNIWRDLVARIGLDTPRLVIVGRRGWENEQIVDMLDRCPAIHGFVEEYGNVSDERLSSLMGGARALLMPSFAEGYGMPVSEALAMGLPVICSDLPALREAGGSVPDFVDPLDGPSWRDLILQYASPGSPRRRAQVERLSDWTPPSWHDHIGIVLKTIGEFES